MSKDWTPGELQAASAAMAAAGQPSYEEFCAEMEAQDQERRIAADGSIENAMV